MDLLFVVLPGVQKGCKILSRFSKKQCYARLVMSATGMAVQASYLPHLPCN